MSRPVGLGRRSSLLAAQPAQAQSAGMTFFVTSNGLGNGADLGGLDGADKQCQKLAQAGGAGAKTWRAYLSTQAADGKPAVNARDRIGKGPWQNAKGVVIAKDVADLHGASNNLTKQTALSEKGEVINGRGDTPNRHDVLTGSQPDGTAFAAGDDRTCKNWTSSTQGAAMLGHADRMGLRDDDAVEILEQLASLARAGWRLLAGRPQEHRRRRPVVLFRGELSLLRMSASAISGLSRSSALAELACDDGRKDSPCAMSSTTGRTSRAAANMSGWRWRRPAPTTPTSRAARAAWPR